ncbi:hypothetical protein CDAR_380371 [Caerostris darwini]|uniref:Uncharacterized protein n=1 Tax=Caerostris darwini TaxID=1538125 RepID=A0AAV4TIJ1_9ARAC|nr:hypothetical protein CDAR_380371 [Caerostris darwini]
MGTDIAEIWSKYNVVDYCGKIPLHHISEKASIACVKFLKMGADVVLYCDTPPHTHISPDVLKYVGRISLLRFLMMHTIFCHSSHTWQIVKEFYRMMYKSV